jgi:hypothetical protein
MSLPSLLDRAPVQSIDEVIGIMQAIDQDLPDSDGVKWFNRLYLRVTTSVGSAVGTRTFNDTPFMTRLDVVFANLYFSALAAGSSDVSRAPSAWRPLLEARNQPGIARIQFALAGMTAHINRDLPDGIVQSFLAMGGDPISADLREQDFNSINDILERVENEVKGRVRGRCGGRRRSTLRAGGRRGGHVEGQSRSKRCVDERAGALGPAHDARFA